MFMHFQGRAKNWQFYYLTRIEKYTTYIAVPLIAQLYIGGCTDPNPDPDHRWRDYLQWCNPFMKTKGEHECGSAQPERQNIIGETQRITFIGLLCGQ